MQTVCLGTGTSWHKEGNPTRALEAYDTAWAVVERNPAQAKDEPQWLRLAELRARAAITNKDCHKARVTLQAVASVRPSLSLQQRQRAVRLLHSCALACLEQEEHHFAQEILSLIEGGTEEDRDLHSQVVRAKAWCMAQLGHPSDGLNLLGTIQADAVSSTEFALCLGLRMQLSAKCSSPPPTMLNDLGTLLRRCGGHTSKDVVQVLQDGIAALASHPAIEVQHMLEAAHLLKQNVGDQETRLEVVGLLLEAMLSSTALSSGIRSLQEMLDENAWKRILHRDRTRAALWNASAKAIEAEDVDQAIRLLDIGNACSVATSMTTEDAAQWQAMRIWCLLRLGRLDEARVALQQARETTRASPRLAYLSFRLHVLSREQDKARDALKELVDQGEAPGREARLGLLSLAFRDCFETSSRSCGRDVLKALIAEGAPNQVMLLRCHLRLVIQDLKATQSTPDAVAVEEAAATSKRALKACKEAKAAAVGSGKADDSECLLDIDWFARMTWNIAVHVSRTRQPREAAPFFGFSCEFDDLLSKAEAQRRKARSSLLAAACYLSRSDERQLPVHSDALHAKRAMDAYQSAAAATVPCSTQSCTGQEPDMSHARRQRDSILAIILQFDIALTLKDEALQKVWEQARGLENPHACFEILAGLALNHRETALAATILQDGVGINTGDIAVTMSMYRMLIDIHVQNGNDAAVLEVARTLGSRLEKANAELLDSVAESVTYVMIKVWNRGVECFSRQERSMARSLCSSSLRLLKCVPSQERHAYSSHMSTNFAKIVATRT